MRPAYVRVDLGDPEVKESPSFAISPVPFLYREGEIVQPSKAQLRATDSYSGLCEILKRDFRISEAILPPAKYFKPYKTETENEERYIYRTVPEGAGEPEWRTKARQALLYAVDEASHSLLFGNGTVTVSGRACSSIEELRRELEIIAEDAGGKRKVKGEAYQPDYDVLVKEALERDNYLLHYSGLPKPRNDAK